MASLTCRLPDTPSCPSLALFRTFSHFQLQTSHFKLIPIGFVFHHRTARPFSPNPLCDKHLAYKSPLSKLGLFCTIGQEGHRPQGRGRCSVPSSVAGNWVRFAHLPPVPQASSPPGGAGNWLRFALHTSNLSNWLCSCSLLPTDYCLPTTALLKAWNSYSLGVVVAIACLTRPPEQDVGPWRPRGSGPAHSHRSEPAPSASLRAGSEPAKGASSAAGTSLMKKTLRAARLLHKNQKYSINSLPGSVRRARTIEDRGRRTAGREPPTTDC
jgi:hypothetical protein